MSGDYDVDMDQLSSYGRTLQSIGQDMCAASSAVSFDGFDNAVSSSLMADSLRLVRAAWDPKRSVCEQHVVMHPQALCDIADAYRNHEDAAQTVIRGFFEGRTA